MNGIFRIARWEFISRLKSRSFFFNTFISPLLITSVFLLPIYFFNYTPDVSVKLVGIIDLSQERDIRAELLRELNNQYKLDNNLSEYEIINVSIEESKPYQQILAEYTLVKVEFDSITNMHNRIKQERADYFQNRNAPNRDFALDNSYERLRTAREEMELMEIETERYRVAMDSVYEREARIAADKMIAGGVLNSYLVFSNNFARTGHIEYYSKNPGDLLDAARLEKIMQNIIIRKRMSEESVDRDQIRDFLRPIFLEKYKVSANSQGEWNIYSQFYGPLIGVFLLFMAIFTCGGYLFGGILMEKSNRVMEVLMSYATSTQIMSGKIIGLGFLGLFQVCIWFGITSLLIFSGPLSSVALSYLSLENSLYFLLYFNLGFLFYGAIFIMASSVFANEYDAQQINQFLRTMAIFPVLISLTVLTEPNSQWIRILSYIPFLSPSIMILRIPLSSVPLTTDIILTTTIMAISITVTIFIAGRLFRVTTLMVGKRPTLKEIIYWIKNA